jgi:L-aminopeptidase/D-esterase-like protein
LLDPVGSGQHVHGVVLAGGSAFGLDAASGVVRFLEESGVGVEMRNTRVPIVPAAILFDLNVGGNPKIRPTADCGYRAAAAASRGAVAEGSVGAGAGATVGKIAGMERAMKAGIGTAALTLPDGTVVAALVAVNAVGDVIDPANGRIIAGVRTPNGRALADARMLVRSGALVQPPRNGEQTTIGVVATNARLTKPQATKVAQMAHDGLARTVSPVHTPVDGDTIFALATAVHEGDVNLMLIGALAAEVTADAVMRAVREATGLPGLPAARDLSPPERR